uniref:ferroxidase n=1 Tax=Albugo laibachii Nc14 TaxID=890382 RepID=F0WYV3_9STRA|nr:conserved hypothetical protein [Albugo laibachii Nc14]|eukprot:CCA26662.1 conserved hypothetical protein [Albugo laibachii Nc14]
MEENQFVRLADSALEEIFDSMGDVEDAIDDADITLSQGVLKIDLAHAGSWVINRQVPNKQLWWSSPLSGPRRYEYNPKSKCWENTRDKTELKNLLKREIEEAIGATVRL